jgi:hypothetical protein
MRMSKNLSKYKSAPVIACHSSTAARLGAVLVRNAAEAKKLGHACIPIRGHDGSRWAWPIEQGFLEAIERR